ncbi:MULTISPECIES: hypothetical protein [Mycolicibacterium]|nr:MULTISPECIES: hypothetical protein [Mycolicibacterium]MBV5246264.1 hypothetical protein [Mycolicibacterium sp. PAM1]MCV7054770.1 hypothetical protein [Mycolicibacterium gilvum]STZ46589.1 putative conserved membrane protein [Mycolicibacterium gilvum]
MLVAALVTLCAAAATAAVGTWSLLRRPSTDFVQQVLRAVAPTQLAAAVMLAAGGLLALAVGSRQGAPAAVILLVCVVGAVATVAAGCWQAAKMVTRENARQTASSGGCGSESACGSCTLSCGR